MITLRTVLTYGFLLLASLHGEHVHLHRHAAHAVRVHANVH